MYHLYQICKIYQIYHLYHGTFINTMAPIKIPWHEDKFYATNIIAMASMQILGHQYKYNGTYINTMATIYVPW